jgi:hypothetical protein
MNFNFTKVTAIVNELGRPTFGWLFTKQNKSRKVVAVDQQHQGNHEVGIYGLLVSNDVTHRH